MSRRPKTDRVPRVRAGGEWTEAAFIGFIRSGLRQMSRRWPPLVRQAALRVRRKYVGQNKRLKWEYECECCRGWKPRKEIEIDHITPCGSLKSLEDVQGFIERMFCEPEGLRVLCDVCHALRTAKAREGTS